MLKIYTTLFATVILLILANELYSQVNFIKRYGYTDNNYSFHYGTNIIEDDNGNYLILGTAGYYSQNGDFSDITLNKIDKFGNPIWAKAYLQSTPSRSTSATIVKTADGNYFISATSTWLMAAHLVYLKVDTSGNVIWSKTATSSSGITSMKVKNQMEFIVSGSTPPIFQSFYGYASLIDTAGNNIWKTGVDVLGSGSATDVIQSSSGDILFAGTSSSTFPYGNIVKLSSSGAFKWNKNFMGQANSICEAKDRNYIVGGYVTHQIGSEGIFIEKLDTAGNNLWQKIYPGLLALKIKITADSGFAVLGKGSYLNGKNSIRILKFDKNDNLQWSKTIAQSDVSFEPFDFVQTQDGGFAIAGYYTYNPSITYGFFLLVKISSSGQICNTIPEVSSPTGSPTFLNLTPTVVSLIDPSNDASLFTSKNIFQTSVVSCESAIPLPLNMTSFKVSNSQKINILQWLTSQEINTGYFIIQRSINGYSFNNIGKLEAMHNVNNTYSYKYIDTVENVPSKKFYYRLQEVDEDGKSTFSNIVLVNMEDGYFTFTPNPSKSIINIQSDDTKMLYLIDYSGKLILKKQISLNYRLDISNLAKGIYLIKAQNSNGNFFIKRLLVQ